VLLQLRDDKLTKAVFVTPTFDKRKTNERQTKVVRKRAFGLRTFRLFSVWVVPTTDVQGGASCPLRRTRAIAPLAPRAPVRRQPPRGSAPTPCSVAIPSYPPSPVVSTNDSPRCQYLDHPWPIIWCARVSRACRSSGASTGSCHRGGRGAPGHATTRAASAGAPSLSIGPRPWRPPPASRLRDLVAPLRTPDA